MLIHISEAQNIIMFIFIHSLTVSNTDESECLRFNVQLQHAFDCNRSQSVIFVVKSVYYHDY